MRDKKNLVVPFLIRIVEKEAVIKANANCYGLLYEPKRPESLVKRSSGKLEK